MNKNEINLDNAFKLLHIGKKCQLCGCTATETHHILERGKSKLYRWAKENAMFLCRECHFGIHHCGAEKPLPTFEILDYHKYKVDNCLSDEDFLRLKCKEYGIKYIEESNHGEFAIIKKPKKLSKKQQEANELRRSNWKKQYKLSKLRRKAK